MATPGGSDGAPKGEHLQPSSSTSGSTSRSSSSATNTEPISLTIRVLEDSTDNFSKEQVVGRGTYGTVYKGMLKNGEEIALKVLYNNTPEINDEQFKHEFGNLMMLNHKNIIRLVGYCYETRHQYTEIHGKHVFAEITTRVLCFEYMPMGSLQKHLYDETQALEWKIRYKIIKGICEGLEYLHNGLEKPIYHLDLKPDNILLDKNMIPKLGDFGLSKLFGEEQTRATQSTIGTFGYMPPEYLDGQLVSKKFDIFSLGVIITKIIAGPKGRTTMAEMSRQEFLDQVHENWRNKLEEMCTSEMLEANCHQVRICTDIALRCLEFDRHKRPDILEIVRKLDETEIMVEKAAFYRGGQDSDLTDMAGQLLAMLIVHGDGGIERKAWDQVQGLLARVATCVADPKITSEHMLGLLEDVGGASSLQLHHPKAEALLRRIMASLGEETIRVLDADLAIPRLREVFLVVAGQLGMLPLCDSDPMYLVDGDSNFCYANVAGIIKCSPQLSAPNAPYGVVSIIGKQSSGKSYLLNCLFGTKFPVMNAQHGRRNKTTRGIMMSRCIGPSFLVLDFEGFNGREMGQDAVFQQQATLFALTVSEVILVNMCVFDICREQGRGTLLFKTIFKERIKLPVGLTNIMVVLRMYDGETPLEILKDDVMESLSKIWKSVNMKSKFEENIKVNVVVLPHKNSGEFPNEVTILRRLLSNNNITNFHGSAKVPASSFSLYSRILWNKIKNNRKLDIPSHQAAFYRGGQDSYLTDMAGQLLAMLIVHGDGGIERKAWDQVQGLLARVATCVADPKITSEHMLGLLEDVGGASSLQLHHPKAEALLRRIMASLGEETIRVLDADLAIPRLREVFLVVAGQLGMLPLCDSDPMYLVDGDSNFCYANVAGIIKCSPQLSAPNAPYGVVSIIGKQSSGKSYLLNCLFGTKFPVMNAKHGRRNKTTRGIMMSRCIGPSFLVLDFEGFNGREMGQDAEFQQQATLFALTVSEVILVNMCVFDICREQGRGTLLFKTIFKERIKLPVGLTNIMVVLRMYDGETPLEILKDDVIESLSKIWKSVNMKSKFEENIKVNVVGLPHTNSREFPKEVTLLRRLLSNNNITNFHGSAKVPASTFSLYSRILWNKIKNNRKLDIPSHQEALAVLLCRHTADNTLKSVESCKDYNLLKSEESPRRFREISESLLKSIVTMYDHETEMYDLKVRDNERQYMLEIINKVFIEDSRELIQKTQRNTLEQFKGEYVKRLKNMKETDVDLPYDDRIAESCVNDFMNLCEDLKVFDSDYLHVTCADLQKDLQSYILYQYQIIQATSERKQAELTRQKYEQNVNELVKKPIEGNKENQNMSRENEKLPQEQLEYARQTLEKHQEHTENMLVRQQAQAEKIISTLQELPEKRLSAQQDRKGKKHAEQQEKMEKKHAEQQEKPYKKFVEQQEKRDKKLTAQQAEIKELKERCTIM